MLRHLHNKPIIPKRTVVIGGGSFVGKAIISKLEKANMHYLALGREQVDLTAPDAAVILQEYLKSTDSVIAISAKAPCRNPEDFAINSVIIKNLFDTFNHVEPEYILNISSDAVYPDEPTPLHEGVPAAPTSMHGAMHLSREIAFQGLGIPLGILRPTLIYGALDPHNGYGPNQFRRLANNHKDITLFGEGEERRDHVHIDDVSELALRMLLLQSTGHLNAATGNVMSFREIAERVVELTGNEIEIVGTARNGPMPHNGYRPFDAAKTVEAFPGFKYIQLEEGLTNVQEEEFGNG